MPIWHLGHNSTASKGFQLAYFKDELGLYFIAQSTSCSQRTAVTLLFLSSAMETSRQTQDEGWHQPAAVTLSSVCLEGDPKQLTIVACHQPPTWRQPGHCLSGLRKPSKLNFLPSKNVPIALELIKLVSIFMVFFWNSKSHEHRSSKLSWSQQRQVSIWQEKKVGWAVS